MERKYNKKNGLRVVSLFAGIGGLDLGFDFAGFDVIWANDFDKFAVQTYKANVSDRIVCDDIRLIKDKIPEHDVLLEGSLVSHLVHLENFRVLKMSKNVGHYSLR